MYCYNNFFPHSKSLLTPWIGARLSVIQKSPMMINAKRHLADVAVSLENKCDNLEARSRRKNIRIMRVPGTRLLCIPRFGTAEGSIGLERSAAAGQGTQITSTGSQTGGSTTDHHCPSPLPVRMCKYPAACLGKTTDHCEWPVYFRSPGLYHTHDCLVHAFLFHLQYCATVLGRCCKQRMFSEI